MSKKQRIFRIEVKINELGYHPEEREFSNNVKVEESGVEGESLGMLKEILEDDLNPIKLLKEFIKRYPKTN